MIPLAYEFLFNQKVGALALAFNTRFPFAPAKEDDQIMIVERNEKLDLVLAASSGDIYCCEDIPQAFAEMIRADQNLLVLQFSTSKGLPTSKVCLLRS